MKRDLTPFSFLFSFRASIWMPTRDSRSTGWRRPYGE